MNVLVTLPAEPDWLDVIDEVLHDEATTVYLDDVDDEDRRSHIDEADALLSWNPHDELSEAEIRATSDAEFMQLMSAGVDHLQFELIPESLAVAANAGAYAEPVAERVLALALRRSSQAPSKKG